MIWPTLCLAAKNLWRRRFSLLAIALCAAALITGVGAILQPTLGVLLLGSTIIALVTDTARAVALPRLSSQEAEPPILITLRTVTPMITTRAIEWTVYFTLLECALVVAMHIDFDTPLRGAAALALLLSPVLYVCLLTFACARIAIVRIADGLLPWAAWLEGVRLVVRRPMAFVSVGILIFLAGACVFMGTQLLHQHDGGVSYKFIRNFLFIAFALASYACLQAMVHILDREEAA